MLRQLFCTHQLRAAIDHGHAWSCTVRHASCRASGTAFATHLTSLGNRTRRPARRSPMATSATEHQHTNRLAKEQSPYLLQHQYNPVDWYPWGQEAFDKAKMEDKPIFLSVGYSTCHWCHVMERESFESEEIGRLLNDSFVPIKVDREERPDVDKVYMTYVQATSGGGGWPMNVFLTPQLEPFIGGTYWPPKDAFGRPGFKTVLQRVAKVWEENRDKVLEQGADTIRQLQEYSEPKETTEVLSDTEAAAALDKCTRQLAGRYDAESGGFGGAPKFPRPSELNALLCDHLRCTAGNAAVEARKSLDMALTTLRKMAAGGVHDHVGGGFHRYSVDEYWHIPHFEKMMYDNTQLVTTYLAAYLLSEDRTDCPAPRMKLSRNQGSVEAQEEVLAPKDPFFARVARDVLDYMQRDMMHPDGGLFSAEDADSEDKQGKKTEGAYYMWTELEIEDAIGPERARVFKPHYFVKPGGNAVLSPRSDPHHEFGGLNTLIERQSVADTAKQLGMDTDEVQAVLGKSRKLLHAQRTQRPRPHLDDKVVAAWNGMAISAFATASRVLAGDRQPLQSSFPVEEKDPKVYMDAAVRAAEFVRAKLWDTDTKRLRRSFRVGPSAAQGFADDYAYMIAGLLDLYQMGGDCRWLRWAVELQDTMDALFWDEKGGGYFSVPEGDPSILLRQKEDYDGAEPAPSSIAASNLFRLSAFCSAQRAPWYRERGERTTGAFADRLKELPLAMPQMCCSLYLQAAGHLRQVIIAGKRGADDTEALLNAAESVFAPDKVTITLDVEDDSIASFWKEFNPESWATVEAAGVKSISQATAYVCQDFTCKAPTTDPVKLRSLLEESRTYGGASWGVPVEEVPLGSLMGATRARS